MMIASHAGTQVVGGRRTPVLNSKTLKEVKGEHFVPLFFTEFQAPGHWFRQIIELIQYRVFKAKKSLLFYSGILVGLTLY